MGVRAYFSGVESAQHFQHCVDAGVERVLMSYWQFYNKNLGLVAQRKKAQPQLQFMVDSGAHSFMEDWTLYKTWSEKDFEDYVKGYVDWMRRNRAYVDVGVELDIDYTLNMVLAGDENAAIGGTIVRRWQQQYFRPLQEIGIPIVYVWHENRKMEGWVEMCSDFDYCGLPGEFSARPDFNRFMSVARRYCTKVHGFAATKQLDFRDMPWYCMTDNHEVLTRTGWKSRKEIKVGDEVLSTDGECSHWKPVTAVHEYAVKDVPMRRFNSRTFSAEVTLNHRWLSMRRRRKDCQFYYEPVMKETAELDADDRIPRAAPLYDKFQAPPLPQDAYAALIGWVWTDGCIRLDKKNNSWRVEISQSTTANPEKVERIRDILTACGGEFSEYFNKADSCIYFSLKGEIRKRVVSDLPGKRLQWGMVTQFTLNQLRLFIQASIQADGTFTPRVSSSETTFALSQKADERGLHNLEVFEAACVMAGVPVTRYSTESNGCPMQHVSGSNVEFIYPRHSAVEDFRHTGHIWCISTPLENFVTRCNGKICFTGNSVDSITWKTGEMYGILIVWDEHAQTLTMEDDKTQRAKYRGIIETAGFDADAIINETNYKEVTKFGLWSMRQMELYYWKKYQHRRMYYDLRLPHPSLVGKFGVDEVNHFWTQFNPEENFPQHAKVATDQKRIILVALAAAQSKDYKTLQFRPEYQDFLAAYVPKLVKPLVTDPALLQQEIVALTAPRNPPPTPRTAPQQIEPVLRIRPRTTDALTDASLEDWSNHPMLNV